MKIRLLAYISLVLALAMMLVSCSKGISEDKARQMITNGDSAKLLLAFKEGKVPQMVVVSALCVNSGHGSNEALQEMIELSDPALKAYIADALGRFHRQDARSVLIKLSTDSDEDVSRTAKASLAALEKSDPKR